MTINYLINQTDVRHLYCVNHKLFCVNSVKAILNKKTQNPGLRESEGKSVVTKIEPSGKLT